MKRLPRTLGLAINLMIACTLGGCSIYGDLCERKMDCEGGNDADYDACVIDYEAGEDLSDLHGCDNDLDQLLECLDTQSHCSNDRFTTDNDCDNERNDFYRCID